MKLSLERRIGLGFGTALVVLVLVTCVTGWNVSRFQNTQYWVGHSREVLSHLEQTLSELLSMQASTRGFILTGSDDVLKPFESGSIRLEELLVELNALIADNVDQQERLARLMPLSSRAREIMLGRIAARRARGLDAATDTSVYLEGQRVVERFRSGVREMIAAERKLLDDRLDRVKRFGRLTVFTLGAASLIATGLVFGAWRRVRRDLYARREVEWALNESLARVEDIYHHAPCGYHSLDREGVFVAINATALRWLGYEKEEVVGRMKFTDVLAPASVPEFQQRFADFMRDGSVENVEYTWRRKDGSTLPVLLNASAIYDRAGKYVASRATVFDVTERKRAEAERDRFFTLSRDLLCTAGIDGYFKRLNPAWEEKLGFTTDELLRRPFMEMIHPEDRDGSQQEVAKLAQGFETIGFENRFACKDGSYRWLRWNARAVPGEGLIYASGHDVTERKAADEHIRWLNADLQVRALQLESANHELESFSYSVSHDLRAPLRHIDGFASLLSKRTAGALDPEASRYLTTISRAAKQMGTLIDDLLAFSRVGRTPLRQERVDQNQLVTSVIADGGYDTEPRRINWDIQALPAVQADLAMMRQVWSNLIGNAVKYSSKRETPCITIGGTVNPESGDATFFVRDNGVGFDMAYADKLFGVFQRLHGPTEFEGTGIGLANVRRIVSRHGGRTWAEARVNEGATFYFSLPSNAPTSSSS